MDKKRTRFSKALTQARKESKLTQREVAQKLNVVTSCYANWEQGRTEPNTDAIFSLCIILKATADQLIGLTDEYGNKNSQLISKKKKEWGES
ncbi:MAG: helix-turn-helix domain-containing protein [Firmicutes bacterium]|nr:helix-turn-helix domain-containing protein [Bacillota bacterium]